MPKFIFIILLIIANNIFAIDFKIGLLRNVNLKSVAISASNNSFKLKEGMNELFELKEGEEVKITVASNKIKLTYNGKFIGVYDTLKLLKHKKDTSIFSVKGLIPGFKQRSYFDELIVFAQKKLITLVNVVDLENYIVGVLESEVGLNRTRDFYKVHAVISRTYALKNQYKFLHEGFYLTDLVNCQVYKGNMHKDNTIISAVNETKNLILVDENMDYITAAYFSNSGGQTNNVEDVWLKALPYLRSIYDPYSLEGYNFEWEKSISKKSWLDYLEKNYDFPVNDSIALNSACNFKQEIRHKYLIDWVYQIPLTQIRNDWKLKSTFFSIFDNKDELIFKGKGFGHGVGLSQEGAMKMIDLGFGFLDVLRFYYTDVHLIDMRMRDFYILD
jgi:stage II sporulation protein D